MERVLNKIDPKVKEFYENSIIALGELKRKPSEKEWNKLAQKNFYMTSVSMKRYAEKTSWTLLYFQARKECRKIERYKTNTLKSDYLY